MILALQTDGPTTRVWLFDQITSDLKPALEWESGRQLADELLGRLEDLIKQHDHSFADLTGVVIFSGPGSFTSLRIGHTVANTLADGLEIPVVGRGGEDWLVEGTKALIETPLGRPAMPEYGAEANITRLKP